MPLSPTDQAAGRDPVRRPARIALDSPLAAAIRAGLTRRRTRQQPRERGLRAFAAFGTLLVHLVFLFGFVLGPAFDETPPPTESPGQFMQVRLLDAPEPPLPVRGAPPKELGPRHQGRASQTAPTSRRSASTLTSVAAQPTPAAAMPVIAPTAKPSAPQPQPVAARKLPASLPAPTPTPQLQPIPLAGEPPTVALPTPSLQPPVPPKFQPEPVRPPQREGNHPLLPPASLALPPLPLPAQAPPPIVMPRVALNIIVPNASAPASVTPARAETPVAPPVSELQPVPLPAQPAPSMNLQTRLDLPVPSVPRELPHVQAAAVEVAAAQLEAIPPVPATAVSLKPQLPAVKMTVADAALAPVAQSAVSRPEVSAPAAVAAATTPAGQPSSAPQPAASSAAAASSAPASSSDQAGAIESARHADTGRDVSTAPHATPQGSDRAAPGEPDGVDAVPAPVSGQAGSAQVTIAPGSTSGAAGKEQGAGQPGGSQPGAKRGELGNYVQLKPHGDTHVMNHGAPNIGYRPTRFEQDWTPGGESSVDTALRRAVEKTTVKHTFHLPRGVRVKCAVMPLLPMALFGCANADPPPRPVAEKAYDRLHLAPANPLVEPVATISSAPPAPMIKFDNSAECAAARVAGGPLPPGCESVITPVLKSTTPAPASSSWVPASDQFH